MEKCLVTKLNGIVNNNSLLALDEFRYKQRGKAGKKSLFYLNTNEVVKIKSDIPVMINGNPLTEATLTGVEAVNIKLINDDEVATISILKKEHKISRWECYEDGLILDFNDMQSISGFKIGALLGQANIRNLDLDSPLLSKATEITNYNGTNGKGNLSSLDVDHITNLRISDSGSYTGSIEVFAKSINMTMIGVQGITNVTGNVDNLAKAMVANGRTSGRLQLELEGSGCTYSTPSSPTKIEFGSSYSSGYLLS